MRFEKWQALGNDYLVVTDAVDGDTVRHLCDRHEGVGADGVLQVLAPDAPGYVARVRIFNPDGSEAELSGNGIRQAILWLRRHGWTDAPTFSVQTIAGEIRPTILDERTCRVDMGRARPRGSGTVEAGGRTWRYEHVEIGNPQTTIHVGDRAELEALDLEAIGPPIEHDPRFPQRTNVSWWTELEPAPDGRPRIRARIFERGVGETRSSGTGAIGAAIGSVLRGGDAPVTVVLDGGELDVDVDEAYGVLLTGWAVPVFAGELITERR